MKKLFFIILLLVPVINTMAQQAISGVITDELSGEPLPGVNVTIKGTTIGTITDIDGNYRIEAKETDTLSFNYLGYLSENLAVGLNTVLDLSLTVNVFSLDELVVVGYGTMQKENITGAVSIVKVEELEDRPNNQIGSLINGRAAGVQVLSNSGKPSQGFNIRIRGTNSINASSEPLYVVDGVPTTDTRSINPSDIESLTVLKDASSAAIYGAQGANGVVLITTKRGKEGKPQFNFDTYFGISSVWKTLKVLNSEQYRDLMTEMGLSTDWGLYDKNTDWQDEVFQQGFSQNYQLSLSGKANETNYYISGGWIAQKGAVRSSEMKRGNFKVNLDQKVNKWLSIGTRVAYTNYFDVDVNDNSSVGTGGVLTGALFTPPVIGVFNEDKTYTSNPFQNWENPLARTDAEQRSYQKDRLLGNVFAEIELLKGLVFKSNYGLDIQHGNFDSFLDPYTTSFGRSKNGISKNFVDKSNYSIIDNTLRYDKDIKQHRISFLAGSVIQHTLWENTQVEAHNFSGDKIKTPNAGSEKMLATGFKSEKANASFIGRINYDYQDKYLFTSNFRADGSSNFGPLERWGYFPSFSAGWRISKESFMENLDVLSDLKIRAGWGINGKDDIGVYAYYGKVGSGANYPIGSVTMPGTFPATIQNNSLKWEETAQSNIGIDASFYNYRVRMSVDAYLKKTTDLLYNAPLPLTTGYGSAYQNVGDLENKGVEFSINTKNLEEFNDFDWTTSFNITFNKNELVRLVGLETPIGDIAGRGSSGLLFEGLPLGTLYGYEWGGVDPATGQAFYVDANGESTFTPNPDTDRKVIGDANPNFYFGLGNTFSYKGLSLTIFLMGMQGNDMLNATRIEGEAMTTPANQLHAVTNRWRKPGDETDIPAASFSVTDNSRVSTRFVEDASFIRLKTVNLVYQIPNKMLENFKIQGAKVYLTGENLLTFTKYSGYDPEVNAFGGSNTVRGIDYGTYPITRNVIVGLNVTF